MRRKKSIFSSPSKKRKKINYKGAFVIMVAGLVLFGSFNQVKAFVDESIQARQEKKIEEEKRLAEEERKRKEEEEAKKRIVGVKHDAKQYTYDAKLVEKKLANYDYTNNGEKIVFLTFDDGTSTTVTPEILRVLEEEDVKATFFLTGQTIENGGQAAKDLVKREFDAGHAIANHSYTHDYKALYPNRTIDLDAFNADFERTNELLKEIISPYFSTRVIRCPGGHMSWKGMDVLDAYLDKNNMASIDWNALNADAEGKKKDAQGLVDYAIKTSEGKEMVVLLMHDTYGKEETAKALPQIIKYYKDNGFTFKTLS